MISNVSFGDRTDRQWRYPSWANLLITLPWALGAAFDIYQFNLYGAVAKRQQIVTGIVRAHEPSNHNCYRYSFSVDRKSYQDCESISSTDNPRIGKDVTVYYDPLDPATNSLTNFSELQEKATRSVPLSLAGIGWVALYIFWRRRVSGRERDANKNSDYSFQVSSISI